MTRILLVGMGPWLEPSTTELSAHSLRSRQFFQALVNAGHTVDLVIINPPSAENCVSDNVLNLVGNQDLKWWATSMACSVDQLRGAVETLIEQNHYEALVSAGIFPAQILALSNTTLPLWADLNGWVMAEVQARAGRCHDDQFLLEGWQQERTVLSRADVVSVINQHHKDAVMGELAVLGRLNQFTLGYDFTRLVPVCPHPLFRANTTIDHLPFLRTPAMGIGADDYILLWSGGYNYWLDVDYLVEGLVRALNHLPLLHFVSTGGAISGYDDQTYLAVQNRLAQHPHLQNRIHLLGWIPAEQVVCAYHEADVGINVDANVPETYFGTRNRVLNMLAAGLPVVSTPGSDIAQIGAHAGAVQPTSYLSSESLESAISECLHDRDKLAMMRQSALSLIQSSYSLEQTTKLLVQWAESPCSAPDQFQPPNPLQKIHQPPPPDQKNSPWSFWSPMKLFAKIGYSPQPPWMRWFGVRDQNQSWHNTRLTTVLLVIIVALAAFFRIDRLGELPPGVFIDEIDIGYHAYSIWNTGRCRHQQTMPLYFWAFRTFHPPTYIYLDAPIVGLFGLTPAAVRFPSAASGILAVLIVFLFVRHITDPFTGLLASLILATMPWHIHLSRLALQQAMMSLFFITGLYWWSVGLSAPRRGWRWMLLAAIAFCLCLMTYDVAIPFLLPLLLLATAIVVSVAWRKHWRKLVFFWGVLTILMLPTIYFKYTHLQFARVHFDRVSILSPVLDWSWHDISQHILTHYPQYYSWSFLFQQGDQIFRHAVPFWGQIHTFCLPLLLIGIPVALALKNWASTFILLGLALYPLAGVLIRWENPSALRTANAMPLFAIVAALGAGWVFWQLGRIRWYAIGYALPGIGLLILLGFCAQDTRRYWHRYQHDYPQHPQSDEAWMVGYREAAHIMEQHRNRYDRLVFSVGNSFENQLLLSFHSRKDPARYQQERTPDYILAHAWEISRWDFGDSISVLMAIHPEELIYFRAYELVETVYSPDGTERFLIIANPKPNRFVDQWLLAGLLDNRDHQAIYRCEVNTPEQIGTGVLPGKHGEVQWVSFEGTRLDFKQFFGQRGATIPGHPEHTAAYAYCRVECADTQPAKIGFIGSDDLVRFWFNGADRGFFKPHPHNPQFIPVTLQQGGNWILLKSTQTIGDWWVNVLLDLPTTPNASLPSYSVHPPPTQLEPSLLCH